MGDSQTILTNPYVSGKLASLERGRGYYILPGDVNGAAPQQGPDGFPIPPTDELRLWYGASEVDYVESGKRNVDAMAEILLDAGIEVHSLPRILDVGCGAGRMLRHLRPPDAHAERWGVDVSALHIAWCQQYLSPPFSFATTTTSPHLPFSDGYFDFVYGGSLFTHISDLADAWFLELRRIVTRKGHLFITIHDERIVQWLITEGRNDRWMQGLAKMVTDLDARTGVLSRPYDCFSIEADARNQTQVFYSARFLTRKWSAWAELMSVTPNAYFRQTGLLFRKR